jgi:hypothetical protein
LSEQLRLAHSNSYFSPFCIALTFKWLILINILLILLLAVSLIRMNLKVIKIFTISFSLKILENWFQFGFIKMKIFFRLVEKTIQTIFQLKIWFIIFTVNFSYFVLFWWVLNSIKNGWIQIILYINNCSLNIFIYWFHKLFETFECWWTIFYVIRMRLFLSIKF